MLERRPEEVIRLAVKGMLPRNRLARKQLTKLKVYAGPEHPHAAQKPQPMEIAAVIEANPEDEQRDEEPVSRTSSRSRLPRSSPSPSPERSRRPEEPAGERARAGRRGARAESRSRHRRGAGRRPAS